MVEEKDVRTPDEESNIDQINHFVTNSEDAKAIENEKPAAVEELPTEEKEEAPKKEHQISESVRIVHKKVTHKPIAQEVKTIEEKPVHHKQDKPRVEIKKVEHKPVTQEQKKIAKEYKKVEPIQHHVEKKIIPIVSKAEHNHIKPEVKKQEQKKLQIESKKNIKETKTKKTFSLRKTSKEEKMANDKEHKEHKKKFKFTKNTLLWIGIGLLAAIIIIAVVLIVLPGKPQPVASNETSRSVAATVNGEPIYLQDVLRDYNNINPMVKSSYSVESVLNKSIDDILLYQEAKNQGIVISQVTIQSEIDTLKTQNNLTDADLAKALQSQGLTLDDAKTLIEKNLMVRKMLDDSVLQNITVTDAQIQTYYLQNMNKFQTPEKVTVQHILIAITPNVTENQSKAKIEQVQKELNDTNFCDLVTKYSDDQGSINNCGKYTFGRGEMVPEFENPSFDMKIGETTIVKSQYGYHLIKKLDTIPASTQNLSDVADQINTTLHDDAAQIKFDALITGLRAKANIINYMSKSDSNNTVTLPNTQPSTPNTTATPAATNLDDFAKCITTKGAVFYGASWCEHCNNQKAMFGESLQYVKYVECAVVGQPQVQTPECTAAGISGYPTWIINNQSYPGEQTIAGLAKLTGCTAP